jgi:hypothetical protein
MERLIELLKDAGVGGWQEAVTNYQELELGSFCSSNAALDHGGTDAQE